MKFGGLFEYAASGTGFWGYCDPACDVVFSPEFVTQTLGALTPAFFPNLPKAIRTNADLLNLPFAGAVVGIGDPSQPPPYNQGIAVKVNDSFPYLLPGHLENHAESLRSTTGSPTSMRAICSMRICPSLPVWLRSMRSEITR